MKKKIIKGINIILIVFLILSCVTSNAKKDNNKSNAVEQIAKTLTSEAAAGNKIKIAVLPFPDSATKKYYRLSYYLNDEFVTAMYREKNQEMKIYERSQIESLLSEMDFNISGLVSTDTAVEIGNMIGADALVIGSLSVLSDQVRINARLVDVESGEISVADNGSIPLDENLKGMLNTVSSGNNDSDNLIAKSDDTPKSDDNSEDKKESDDTQDKNVKDETTVLSEYKAGDISFKITDIRKDANMIVFDMVLENLSDEDKKVIFVNNLTYFIDKNGKKHNPNLAINFFDSSANPYNQNNWIVGTVFQGLPVKGKLIFADVDYDKSTPAILGTEIRVGETYYKLIFKNLLK